MQKLLSPDVASHGYNMPLAACSGHVAVICRPCEQASCLAILEQHTTLSMQATVGDMMYVT